MGAERKGGFTLVEIMLVVLIIGLLLALAIPNIVKARGESRMNACINNLRMIEHATEQTGAQLDLSVGTIPPVAAVNSNIKGGVPACPVRGVYTYPAVGGSVECSIHGTIAAPRRE